MMTNTLRHVCMHCPIDGEQIGRIRVAYEPGPRAFDRRTRVAYVCTEHLADELVELRHLGFNPRIVLS